MGSPRIPSNDHDHHDELQVIIVNNYHCRDADPPVFRHNTLSLAHTSPDIVMETTREGLT